MSAIPRGADRRQGPRRGDEVAMHFATINVVQAALAWADGDGENTNGEDSALLRAVETYRQAEASLAEADAVH